MHRATAVVVPVVVTALAGCAAPAGGGRSGPRDAVPPRVVVEPADGCVHVTLDGAPFTTYRWAGQPVPVLHPVRGPGGVPMTRSYPLVPGDEAPATEARDHPHHRSLWFAHGDVDGVDFWHSVPGNGRIVHDALLEPRAGEHLRTRNLWLDPEGNIVCHDERGFAFGADGATRWIDATITVSAERGPLTFGDTKEGTFALRLRPELRLRGEVAVGQVKNAAGHEGTAAWGKRARWVDYHGEVDGRILGVAILDHPDNPRHPTWWHARDYGLFAANPFGAHDFEGAPAGTGDLVVPGGGSLTLRYRVLFHEGVRSSAELDAAWREFADSGERP